MKPKHQRLVLTLVGLGCIALAVVFILNSFKDNMVYFYSPSELQALPKPPTGNIRVGGLVKEGSVEHGTDSASITFILTDLEKEIRIAYQGMLPNLFREGQGMVANGYLQGDGSLKAENLLAKHDEKYMPKEVSDSLKKSGKWKGNEGE